MSDSHIQTRVDGTVYHVMIDRPEKRNALTPEMMDAISVAITDVDRYPDIRVVILSGNGPEFSSGIDILSLMQSRAEAADLNPGRWLRKIAQHLQNAVTAIEQVETPVIAALHGRVMGMGLELALACDLRVATESCQLSLPETRMGLIADVGGATRLARLVGPSRAKDMLMTVRAVSAREALGWGLVDRVVADSELGEATAALATQIAKNAPLAVGLAKRVIDQGDGLDKHTQMAIERWAQSLLITTDDALEAGLAFMEKREPRFRGK